MCVCVCVCVRERERTVPVPVGECGRGGDRSPQTEGDDGRGPADQHTYIIHSQDEDRTLQLTCSRSQWRVGADSVAKILFQFRSECQLPDCNCSTAVWTWWVGLGDVGGGFTGSCKLHVELALNKVPIASFPTLPIWPGNEAAVPTLPIWPGNEAAVPTLPIWPGNEAAVPRQRNGHL